MLCVYMYLFVNLLAVCAIGVLNRKYSKDKYIQFLPRVRVETGNQTV